MTSQTDLDQGGTYRTFLTTFLGPTVGWVSLPANNILPITAAGTYAIAPDTTLITVNVAGSVTLTLPSCVQPTVPAGAQPGLFGNLPITIVDIGGNAQAHPITINPQGGQTIMGLSTLSLATNYGSYTLIPLSAQSMWNTTQ